METEHESSSTYTCFCDLEVGHSFLKQNFVFLKTKSLLIKTLSISFKAPQCGPLGDINEEKPNN